MKVVRIGTRDSRLAMAQARLAARAIEACMPGIGTELVAMKTTGDRILNRTLDKIGGKGLFVKELDLALLDGRIDIAVHSAKDLPMELDSRLPVVAASLREDARDVLVLPQGAVGLDAGKPVGCSSARRRVQLRRLYPEMTVEPVRGNVITRLEKLDNGGFSALVLAAAGLRRLGLEHRISKVFEPEEMLPAAGQGILAVQAMAGQETAYLSLFHSRESMLCLLAERAFVRALDGGCTKPCGAYACLEQGRMTLHGMYAGEDESVVWYDSVVCDPSQGEEAAKALAERMKGRR